MIYFPDRLAEFDTGLQATYTRLILERLKTKEKRWKKTGSIDCSTLLGLNISSLQYINLHDSSIGNEEVFIIAFVFSLSSIMSLFASHLIDSLECSYSLNSSIKLSKTVGKIYHSALSSSVHNGNCRWMRWKWEETVL